MRKIKLIFVAFVICLVVITTVFLLGKWSTNRYNDTAVVKEIRSLNRWETASYTVEKIIDSGNSGNAFQQFLFGNRVLLIAHGQVIGGFDLSTLPDNSIHTNGKSITVNFPAPSILSVSLDEAQTRVYDKQKGLLVPENNNLESDARLKAVTAIRKAACDGGIISTTAENARKQLNSLLKSLGYKSITINIPQESC